MNVRAMLLRAVCACVLIGHSGRRVCIPFHAPRNDVSWAGQWEQASCSGRHGSIRVSAESVFRARANTGEQFLPASIFGCNRDAGRKRGMILAFYWPERRLVPFSIRQFQEGLVV